MKTAKELGLRNNLNIYFSDRVVGFRKKMIILGQEFPAPRKYFMNVERKGAAFINRVQGMVWLKSKEKLSIKKDENKNVSLNDLNLDEIAENNLIDLSSSDKDENKNVSVEDKLEFSNEEAVEIWQIFSEYCSSVNGVELNNMMELVCGIVNQDIDESSPFRLTPSILEEEGNWQEVNAILHAFVESSFRRLAESIKATLPSDLVKNTNETKKKSIQMKKKKNI